MEDGKGICWKIVTLWCKKPLALELGVLWSKACVGISGLKLGSAKCTDKENVRSLITQGVLSLRLLHITRGQCCGLIWLSWIRTSQFRNPDPDPDPRARFNKDYK
jgi:hypothetical protein